MIPHPWPALVIGLGVYRLCRLVGWDDFPPILAVRRRLTGEQVVTRGSVNTRMGLTDEQPTVEFAWRRPLLAHFLGCAFCFGWWASLATYLAWLAWPVATMYAAAPFALSAFVGIVARNLDP